MLTLNTKSVMSVQTANEMHVNVRNSKTATNPIVHRKGGYVPTYSRSMENKCSLPLKGSQITVSKQKKLEEAENIRRFLFATNPIVHSLSWERARKGGYVPTYSRSMENKHSHPLKKEIWRRLRISEGSFLS